MNFKRRSERLFESCEFCRIKMAKLEHLNTVFTDRLLAVAGELFQVVTGVIKEYQEEIDRKTAENADLKKLLAAERLANGRAEASKYDSARQAIPPNSNSSVIQVKVELSTTKQDNVPPESINDPSAVTPAHYISGKIKNEEINNDRFQNDSDVTIKSEPKDSQTVTCDASNRAIESVSILDNNVDDLQHDEVTDPSSHGALQRKTAERTVYCRYCGKAFGNPGQLRRHTAVHQKDRPRPYRCDLCGKCFSYAQVLQVHRRTHTGERPFHCKYCGRRFNQQGHLKEHERIHTGEKPFGCPVCGKRFVQSSQVRKHISYRQCTTHQS